MRVYSGLGLLGFSLQRIVFHYGSGANGKSVFMETLMRVLGGLACGLPAESITGDTQRGSGQASPDLAGSMACAPCACWNCPPTSRSTRP